MGWTHKKTIKLIEKKIRKEGVRIGNFLVIESDGKLKIVRVNDGTDWLRSDTGATSSDS